MSFNDSPRYFPKALLDRQLSLPYLLFRQLCYEYYGALFIIKSNGEIMF